jgi:hypothetical protein
MSTMGAVDRIELLAQVQAVDYDEAAARDS